MAFLKSRMNFPLRWCWCSVTAKGSGYVTASVNAWRSRAGWAKFTSRGGLSDWEVAEGNGCGCDPFHFLWVASVSLYFEVPAEEKVGESLQEGKPGDQHDVYILQMSIFWNPSHVPETTETETQRTVWKDFSPTRILWIPNFFYKRTGPFLLDRGRKKVL